MREDAREYQRRWREKCIAEGRCIICGRSSSAKTCDACREKRRAYAHARRERRKAAGLCVHCSERAVPGRTMCPRHFEEYKGGFARLRAARIRDGLCPACGKPRAPDRRHCPECLHLQSAKQKRRCEANRAAGNCYTCGKPRDRKGTLCSACCAALRETIGALKRARREAGRCEYCGTAPPEDGRTRCRPCLDKKNAAALAWARRTGRARPRPPAISEAERKRRASRYSKRISKLLRSAGICVACHTRKAQSPHVECKPCRLEHNKRAAAYQRRIVAERKAQGVCLHCGAPTAVWRAEEKGCGPKRVGQHKSACDACKERMGAMNAERRHA